VLIQQSEDVEDERRHQMGGRQIRRKPGEVSQPKQTHARGVKMASRVAHALTIGMWRLSIRQPLLSMEGNASLKKLQRYQRTRSQVSAMGRAGTLVRSLPSSGSISAGGSNSHTCMTRRDQEVW